jgi:hypothetical protein
MNNECKGYGRKQCWPNKYLHGILLEKLRKTIRTSAVAGLKAKSETPEYEAGLLTTTPPKCLVG